MPSANLGSLLGHLSYQMAGEVFAHLSDQQLVEKALAECNEAIFQTILRRHGPMVYRVCWRVLQHTQDVEDAFQATFLILARKLRSVRKQASLASWLHGVAFRVSLKAKAQIFKRQLHEKQKAIPIVGPSEDNSFQEISSILDSELQNLPEKWRLPLILCYLEGRTQDEAANELGWSKNTLRARLEEARNSLGRRLTNRGATWPIASSAMLISDSITPPGWSADLFPTTSRIATNAILDESSSIGVSANTALLTKGIIQTMFLKKVQIAIALFMGFGVLTATLITSDLFGQDQTSDGSQRDRKFFHQTKEDAWSDNSKELSGMNLPNESTSGQSMKPLLGNWVVVSTEPPIDLDKPLKDTIYRFEEGKLTIRMRNEQAKVVFTYETKFDPNKNPKVIDLIEEMGNRRSILRGIYRFEKEKLIICLGMASGDGVVVKDKRVVESQRPTEFKLGTDIQMMTLEPLNSEQSTGDDKEDKESETLKKKLSENLKLLEKLEELIQEQVDLTRLANQLTKDLNRAREEGEKLDKLIEAMKAMNKKLRDELGLRDKTKLRKF